MEIKISKNRKGIHLVELCGVMDLCGSNELKDLVMKMIENKVECYIISLEKVESINSSGIGSLIYIFSTLKKLKNPVIILCSGGPVLEALESARLKSYFKIAPTLKEAVAKIGQSATNS